MKVGILAGGRGSRIGAETIVRPKPMIEIGGRPLLWHIMARYGSYGFNDFVVACGYKGDVIKQWFLDQLAQAGSLALDFGTGLVRPTRGDMDPDWTVDLVDTGLDTGTGGRIKRLQPYLGDGTFMLTWGDGLADIDVPALLAFHRDHGRLATITVVRPPARFGHVEIVDDQVVTFEEKPEARDEWINGAFFVLEPGVFDYIDRDETMFEREPLERLATDGLLMAYRHTGFWQCMDDMNDKCRLEALWQSGAPWQADPALQPTPY